MNSWCKVFPSAVSFVLVNVYIVVVGRERATESQRPIAERKEALTDASVVSCIGRKLRSEPGQ